VYSLSHCEQSVLKMNVKFNLSAFCPSLYSTIATSRNELHKMAVFYLAMHCSAKRGIEIACRPSDCLSVCDVGGS